MSGLVGYFSRRAGDADGDVLVRMGNAVQHRGAPSWASWSSGGAGVAASQLLILQDGRLVLAGDIRLDNRAELAGLLGQRETESSDIELVGRLWLQFGQSFVDNIRGDFAFVVVDHQEGKIHCYRDHFGVRPFYYAVEDGLFVFGSELNAILSSGLVSEEVDRVRLEDFLIGRLTDQERTFYQSIKRLPPASELTVTAGEIRHRTYWSIEDAPDIEGSPEELAPRFREIFFDAVSARSGRGTTSCMLSGGLDSSSVVALAASLTESPESIHSYSVQFPYLEGRRAARADESRFARAVVQSSGVTGHVLSGDTATPLGTLSLMTKIHGQPFEVPNAYLDVIAMTAVRERGGSVLLTGLEGDLTISHGDGYLLELAYAGEWEAFFRESEALIARSGATSKMVLERYIKPVLATTFREQGMANLKSAASVLAGRFEMGAVSLMWKGAVRDRLRDWYYSVTGKESFEDRARLDVIRKDYHGREGMIERMRQSEVDIDNARGQRSHHVAYLQSGYAASLLEFSERNAAFFGLDIRHPFFDKKLVEFSVGLPGSTKLHDGWTRYILRLAMEQILPPQVQWRVDKAVLAPNFIHLMEADSPEKVRKLAQAAVEAFPEVLDKTSVNNLLDRGKYATLWNILSVGEWVLHKRN